MKFLTFTHDPMGGAIGETCRVYPIQSAVVWYFIDGRDFLAVAACGLKQPRHVPPQRSFNEVIGGGLNIFYLHDVLPWLCV